MSFSGHNGPVLACCIYKTFLVSAGYDKIIRIWNVEKGELLFKLEGHEHIISSIDVYHQNTLNNSAQSTAHIISGSWDRSVCIWRFPLRSAKNRNKRLITSPHSNKISNLKTNSGDSGDDEHSHHRVHCSEWMLHKLKGHANRVKCVRAVQCVSSSASLPSDGNGTECAGQSPLLAVSGSDDGIIIVWDIIAGDIVHTLLGHTHFILHLAVYQSGGWEERQAAAHSIDVAEQDTASSGSSCVPTYTLVSHSSDRTLRVWDLSTGEQSAVLPYQSINSISSSSSGSDHDSDAVGGDDSSAGSMTTNSQDDTVAAMTVALVCPDTFRRLLSSSAAGDSSTIQTLQPLLLTDPDSIQSLQQQQQRQRVPVIVTADKSNIVRIYSTSADCGAIVLLSTTHPCFSVSNSNKLNKSNNNSSGSSLGVCGQIVSLAVVDYTLDLSLWGQQQSVRMDTASHHYVVYTTDRGAVGYIHLSPQTQAGGGIVDGGLQHDMSRVIFLSGNGGNNTNNGKGLKSSGNGSNSSKAIPPWSRHHQLRQQSSSSNITAAPDNSGDDDDGAYNAFHCIAVSSGGEAIEPSTATLIHTKQQQQTPQPPPPTNARYIAVCGADGVLLVKPYYLPQALLPSVELPEPVIATNNSSAANTPVIRLPAITIPSPTSTANKYLLNEDSSGVTFTQRKHLLSNYDSLIHTEGGGDNSLSSLSGHSEGAGYDDSIKTEFTKSRANSSVSSHKESTQANPTFWQSLVGDSQFSLARIKFHTKVPANNTNITSVSSNRYGSNNANQKHVSAQNQHKQQLQQRQQHQQQGYHGQGQGSRGGARSRGGGSQQQQQYAQQSMQAQHNQQRKANQNRQLLPLASNNHGHQQQQNSSVDSSGYATDGSHSSLTSPPSTTGAHLKYALGTQQQPLEEEVDDDDCQSVTSYAAFMARIPVKRQQKTPQQQQYDCRQNNNSGQGRGRRYGGGGSVKPSSNSSNFRKLLPLFTSESRSHQQELQQQQYEQQQHQHQQAK